VAAVALANKNARIIWALLTRGENYRAQQSSKAERLLAATAPPTSVRRAVAASSLIKRI